MPKFYVTYQSRIPQLSDKFSIVEAPSYEEARQKVFDVRGPSWAFLYTEEQFMGEKNVLGIKYPSQIEAFGLTEVPLTDKYL